VAMQKEGKSGGPIRADTAKKKGSASQTMNLRCARTERNGVDDYSTVNRDDAGGGGLSFRGMNAKNLAPIRRRGGSVSPSVCGSQGEGEKTYVLF